MKATIIVSDPPWNFSDSLTMSSVSRGASSNYPTLNNNVIKDLDVESIVADDALLALWVPSSMLQDGLDTMEKWGFKQKQTFVWVKVVKEPLFKWIKEEISLIKSEDVSSKWIKSLFKLGINLNKNILAFGMGRLFRQTHEICLIGIRGKIYTKLENKSQRSVIFDVNLKHSAKPEGLQDSLDIMFPDKSIEKLEMFARRERKGWKCVGNEIPTMLGEDIRDTIEKLKV